MPATGYAIRKRLVEPGVEAWGGVGVASIYSVLVDPAHPLAFHVAITILALIPRELYIDARQKRLATLERNLTAELSDLEPEVRNAARLWRQLAETEASWVRETIGAAAEAVGADSAARR